MTDVGPIMVERLVRPRSLAIVGASPDKRSMGGALLANFAEWKSSAELHLVSRSRSEIDGRPCVGTIDELSAGIDLVLLLVPEAAVIDAVQACVRRQAGGAVVFAAGFAEVGPEGRTKQIELSRVAREGGLALAGPNCIGITNHVDGLPLTFEPIDPAPLQGRRGIGVVAQSGGMVSNIRPAILARGLGVSYTMSTGNEAVVGLEDYMAFLIADENTAAIAIFAEQIRRPRLFLELAKRARRCGKPVVVMNSGRSVRARLSLQSHTGALAGEHGVVRTLLERQAVVCVDTMDELVDVVSVLARFPKPAMGGTAILTNSGAFCGIALDFCSDVDLPVASLNSATVASLRPLLPPFAGFSNPVDVATAGMTNPNIFGDCAQLLLDDPATGSILVAVLGGGRPQQLTKAKSICPVLSAATKPAILAIMGGEAPLAEEALRVIYDSGICFFRSPDRAIRALAHVTAFGRALEAAAQLPSLENLEPIVLPAPGVLAEYQGKQVLTAAGLTIPAGALARTFDEARAVAAAIGYPVVLKAQASTLSHKSDAGGVAVGINDAHALDESWKKMQRDVAAARADIEMDGILVEKMATPGLEMIIGARRDPEWGPVLMVGLGGVWTEALKDVCLLAPDVGEEFVAAMLRKLKAAALFDGFRGSEPLDLGALAAAVVRIGALMRACPGIDEIDINPLVVYPQGRGVIALDALVVSS